MTTHPYRAAVEQGASMAQTILVTGSNGGFGRLTVETLARQGYRVFAGMRAAAGKNAPAAEELRARAQRERLALHIIEIDVTDNASVERAIAVIIETTGRLDVVVNNAGVSYSGPLEAFTLEQVRQQFETNVFSVLRVNRAVLPQMREQGSGLLLQMGSIAGRLAFPFLGLYGATKFALEGLTESYRYELAPFGIDAAIIEPGTYPTTISANRQTAADGERFALYQAGIDAFTVPFYAENRSATPPDPQEVADAVAHVIAQPAGERPLRTVVATVAQRQAPQALNDAATQAMQSYLEALNIPAAALALQGEKEEVRKQL
jgi:NAD(P)-dependent dehydrogenase (short-subunit alcohol dehydrogenase family)